jgi:hypothetical protein
MHVLTPRFAGQPAAAFKMGLACAVTLLLAATTAHANSINLVQNGDFSSNAGLGQLGYNTSATDWSNPYNQYNFLFSSSAPSGSTGGWINGEYGSLSLINVTTPPVGANFVGLDADFQTGPLQQTITGLKVGDTYNLQFYWAASQQTYFSGPTTQQLQISLGGQTDSTNVYNLPSQTFSGWKPGSMLFTATSNSEVLSILAQGSPQVPPFTLVTDVSLTKTPEPETLPLILTGLLVGVGLLKYRGLLRRSQQSL